MMTSNTNDNEQWLLNGNCDKCRKNNYCGTPCAANKKRINKIVEDTVLNKMMEYAGTDLRKELASLNKNRY